ncbi:acyltransferase [Fulvivirga sp.]|uniref:acyltransferase n=1 Tax=Fulvivirga sp. TaxID=1931237 RepID=UPI0032EB3CC6
MEKSQLRKHLKFSIFNKFRSWVLKFKLKSIGNEVYIDKNVEFLRYPNNITVGDNVVIKEGARICSCNEKAKISIGNHSTIGYHTFIFASNSIEIGDDCLIAPFVYIVDSNHKIETGLKINQQSNDTAPIKIGNDVWIASNVTILKGVTIDNGAVVAANSVVNSDIQEFEIYGGTPARKIGERK